MLNHGGDGDHLNTTTTTTTPGNVIHNKKTTSQPPSPLHHHHDDLENQLRDEPSSTNHHHLSPHHTFITVVVSTAATSTPTQEEDLPPHILTDSMCVAVPLPPKKTSTACALSRTPSSHHQCRVCQQEKDEDLIDLGCQCKGGLAKAHRSCIDTWFRMRGSNKCEICQEIAVNVPPPESQPSGSYWVWRIDPNFRPPDSERGCFNPLWVAFSILIGGLLLDVLISITLGVSALPVNIIIGIIVVLGLGTALRLALEFFQEWNIRRVTEREDDNVNLGYHPAL